MIYTFSEDGTATFVLTEAEQEVMFYITTYWDTAPEVSEDLTTEHYPELVPAWNAWKRISGVLQANAQSRSTPEAGVL